MRARRRATAAALGLLLGGLSSVSAGLADAATFAVTPIRIVLSGQTKSGLLTLRNTSQDPLRFQLRVFAWAQGVDGEMLLAPTRDIVFFPPLLALAPGEERKVRIGSTFAAPAVERTYRLFVEQMPPLQAPGQVRPAAVEVRVLARVGIPIFHQPPQPTVRWRIEGLAVRRGLASFELWNLGNVHLVPDAVRLSGYGDSGEPLFARQLHAWYILAGTHRAYRVALPGEECERLRRLVAEVEPSQGTPVERAEVPVIDCGH